MKPYKALIITAILFMTTLCGMTQQVPMRSETQERSVSDAEYACQPVSVFSQLPGYFGAVWFGDDAYGYTRIADDYTASGPIVSIRFWGSNYPGAAPGESQTFIIKFYQRDQQDPDKPGTEVYSFTLTGTPQPLSMLFANEYQMDFTFPEPVLLLDGWVSLTRVNPDNQSLFGWVGGDGGNSRSFFELTQGWDPSGGNMAYCLGGMVGLPISNYALFLGMLLIAIVMILRYRRIL